MRLSGSEINFALIQPTINKIKWTQNCFTISWLLHIYYIDIYLPSIKLANVKNIFFTTIFNNKKI